MEVFDSNIWVFGITETGTRPVELLEQLEAGEREVVLDAYIYEEVRQAFKRSTNVRPSDLEKTESNFAVRIAKSPYITSPGQQSVERMDLDSVRESAVTNLIADTLGIQPKDAPILRLAYQWLHRSPTIYTNDEDFADLVPAEYNLPEISIRHVPR